LIKIIRKRFVFFLCLCILLFLNKSPGDMQKKTKIQQELKHEVTVTLKLIQVYVTDKKGNPIMDLTQSDFDLKDNGKTQDITEFEKHILYPPEKIIEKKGKEEFISPDITRKFFLFFDFAFNDSIGITKSKKAALHFMETQVRPEDEVGILSYSLLGGLGVLAPLTTDHERIRDLLKRMSIKKILGAAEGVYTIEDIFAENEEQDSGEAIEPEEIQKQILKKIEKKTKQQQTLEFIKIMTELAKGLRYIDGHKNMIYFSSVEHPGDVLLQADFEEMLKEFASSNCPFYSIYTKELGSVLPSITVHSVDINKPSSGFKSGMTSHALKMLSHDTGGKCFGNINFYDEIMEEIQNVTGSYYILGYYIDEKWDGKFHEIKVKVKREGCQVRSQKGYFNPKHFYEYSKLEKRLHLARFISSEISHLEPDIDLPVKALACTYEGKLYLILFARIPTQFIPEIHEKKVDILDVIKNERKDVVDSPRWEVDLTSFPRKDIHYYSFHTLDPGFYEARIILRNQKTGKVAMGFSSLKIEETPETGICLNEPLILAPDDKPFYLKGNLIQRSENTEEDIGLMCLFPFDLEMFSPVISEIAEEIPGFLVLVRCSVINIASPDIRISGILKHISSGEEKQIGSFPMENYSPSEFTSSLAFFREDLKKGKYIFRLSAEELKTRTTSQTETTFFVE